MFGSLSVALRSLQQAGYQYLKRNFKIKAPGEQGTGNMGPLFFQDRLNHSSVNFFLDEPSSKHIIQVLRMTKGERIRLTNGEGMVALAEIIDDHRKKTEVKILSSEQADPPKEKLSIAISPVKNTGRFEWFLEKATEIGVSEIIPVICERTEKSSLKTERMNGILISAMLQSGQIWKPVLSEPIKFNQFIKSDFKGLRFIAHCGDDQEKTQLSSLINKDISNQILIGPEGDFASGEIKLALEKNFHAVSLGETRLRTETAGIVAATIIKFGSIKS